MDVLVAVASRHGGTWEIGEVLAEALRGRGHVIDVKAPEDVTTVAGYDAVVLGSAVYVAHWLPAARDLADRCADEAASHTEFTRVLAEHGSAGVATIVLMGMLVLYALRRAGPSLGMTVCFVTWAVAQMFYANLRIAAVPFAFAFAFVQVRSDLEPLEPDGDADAAAPLATT